MAESGGQSRAEGAKPGEVSSEARGDAESLVGRVISGRYRVIECLATGGMSSVYRGEHIHMRKGVAIKVLNPKAEKLPELVLRFQREAIAGAHVQHPNIAAATDFGQLEDGSYFLVLEYVPGVTLKNIIAKGPLPVPRAVAIARQIASALKAAHDMGVVHRDIKPANVMLLESQNDAVKVIDFGLAQVNTDQVPTIAPPVPGRQDKPEQALTAVGMVFGTVAYMAPEAALGMGAVDARSDLYALGMTLYEMLAGRHPFDASEPFQLFLQQRTVIPAAIGVCSPGVEIPGPIEAIVAKLLDKDPNQRPQSAGCSSTRSMPPCSKIAFDMVEPIHPLAPGDAPATPLGDAAVPAPLGEALLPDASDEAATVARPWGAAVEAAAAEMRAEETSTAKAKPLPAFPMPMTAQMAAFKPLPGSLRRKKELAPWRLWLTKQHLTEGLAALRKGKRPPPWVYGALGAAFLVSIWLLLLVFRSPATTRAEAPAAAPGRIGRARRPFGRAGRQRGAPRSRRSGCSIVADEPPQRGAHQGLGQGRRCNDGAPAPRIRGRFASTRWSSRGAR